MNEGDPLDDLFRIRLQRTMLAASVVCVFAALVVLSHASTQVSCSQDFKSAPTQLDCDNWNAALVPLATQLGLHECDDGDEHTPLI